MAHDRDAASFVNGYAAWTPGDGGAAEASAFARVSARTLEEAVILGDRESVVGLVEKELEAGADPFELVRGRLIPAITEVGSKYERREYFLPQLLRSAETMQTAFARLKPLLEREAQAEEQKVIVVATVEGDIHDIGKNIVKMLLDNYGYTVFDLGRDVDPQEVLKTVQERDIKLVGLSALMTTTVVAMEETIKLLHAEVPGVKIIVGGAVLTPEYAKQIGADYYAKDAAESARIAEEVFGK